MVLNEDKKTVEEIKHVVKTFYKDRNRDIHLTPKDLTIELILESSKCRGKYSHFKCF